MLSRELREALDRHRRAGMFWNPTRELRRVGTLPTAEFEVWVGERPDGAVELVRSGAGPAAVELLLNEVAVAREVGHRGLPRLLWTARTGDEGLALGFAWRSSLPLTYPLDLRWLLRSFIALARAAGALHGAGWIHADLKPEAVSWSEDPDQLLLSDLRMAQRPGPRRFDAFSARFAPPEQVARGELDFSADVYALGVMLYSLFIRERFPTILMPAGSTAGAGPTAQQAALSPITSLGALLEEDEPYAPPRKKGGPPVARQMMAQQMLEPIVPQMLEPIAQQNFAPPPPPLSAASGGQDAQAVLGAKILFALQLDRVVRRTADIGVAKELLAVIERATAQKPADRFQDANVFAEELAKLLALAEELVNGAEG